MVFSYDAMKIREKSRVERLSKLFEFGLKNKSKNRNVGVEGGKVSEEISAARKKPSLILFHWNNRKDRVH